MTTKKKTKEQPFKYYSLNAIKRKKATYNIIFGERSNGKTFSLLIEAVKKFHDNKGEQFAYVRRWKEDVIGRRASNLFSSMNKEGKVSQLTNGDYSGVYYLSGKFFLCNYDVQGKPVYNEFDCLGYTFALSDTEHNKSNDYPKVTTIVFDEFLTKNVYLQDEFVLFMNTVSTIVRLRTNIQIFMLGNTVNKYCPYFQEMGLKHIKEMKQGTIDVYGYGDSGLSVAVEYCASMESKKVNNFYFAFNNPKLEMITGGAWELDIYPHLPYKYKPKNILFTYFIEFNENIYQCEIIEVDKVYFTFVHVKTTELQNTDKDLIYSLDYNPQMNYNRNVLKPINKVQTKVAWFFKTSRVFYQNNEVGDSIKNYIKICGGL